VKNLNRKLSHRERLETCLAEGPLDRLPIALWRHFPVDDQEPESLASAVLFFQRLYDFDLVKVTPASSFCLQEWGSKDEWRGNPEGTRDYTTYPIQSPEDWEKLQPLDPRTGTLGAQMHALQIIIQELSPATPVLQTVFSPMSQAKNLVGRENLLVHLRRYPDAVHAGLTTIAETTRRFIEAAIDTGISGVFYAVQHAQFGLLSIDEHDAFNEYYDLQVLEAVDPLWLNMLHLHGSDVMFREVANYPVQVINWHDRDTPPSLSQALEQFPGVLCGGLQRDQTMLLGTPDQVMAEARDAIQQTQGRRLILGTGCVMMTTTPHGNIQAARQSVELAARP
jgi:uroporphyrinogen decarboxylase